MTPALFTLDASESVARAARLMVREGIGRVVVMDRGEMVGILTSSDILSRVAGGAGVDVDLASSGPIDRQVRGAGARAARAESSFAPNMKGDWS